MMIYPNNQYVYQSGITKRTVTTVREYDGNGNLTKETVTEVTEHPRNYASGGWINHNT